jgi:hypothetical protein
VNKSIIWAREVLTQKYKELNNGDLLALAISKSILGSQEKQEGAKDEQE